jgi:predicted nucleotidyltransferase
VKSTSKRKRFERKRRMETKESIKETLKGFKPILQEKFKVKEIGIFGSYVRGEESEESDVDILVEFSEPIGWEFIDLIEFLEKILGRKVDLVTVRALKPQLKDKILKEVVYA